MMIYLAAYALLGAVTGVLAGLLGIGGGLVVVPALMFLFLAQGMEATQIAHLAIASSLATIIPTALSSIRAHYKRGAVDWQVVRQMALWLLLGALLGAWFAGQMDTGLLRQLFAYFLLLVGAQMLLLKLKPDPRERKPSSWLLALTGAAIGTISGLVGVGGGTMTVPFLAWHGKPLTRAVATSSACGLPIALGGTLGFMGFGEGGIAGGWATGSVYWPAVMPVGLFSVLVAPLGAQLAHALPVVVLKRLFALFLLLLAAKMLLI